MSDFLIFKDVIENALATPSDLEHETQWYVLVDAAQVPSAEIDWSKIYQRGRWYNLLNYAPEGDSPEVCVHLGLIDVADDLLEWSLALEERHPFTCSWLQSSWLHERLANHLSKQTQVHLPNQQNGLLRFYDPCILDALVKVLSEQQQRILFAGTTQWLTRNREGGLASFQSQPQLPRTVSALSLDQQQLRQLQWHGRADNLIAEMKVNEHLPLDADPFKTYRHVSAAIAALDRFKIDAPKIQYPFCVMTLDAHIGFYKSPELDVLLNAAAKNEIDLIDELTALQG